jgi:hypothetical protein
LTVDDDWRNGYRHWAYLFIGALVVFAAGFGAGALIPCP